MNCLDNSTNSKKRIIDDKIIEKNYNNEKRKKLSFGTSLPILPAEQDECQIVGTSEPAHSDDDEDYNEMPTIFSRKYRNVKVAVQSIMKGKPVLKRDMKRYMKRYRSYSSSNTNRAATRTDIIEICITKGYFLYRGLSFKDNIIIMHDNMIIANKFKILGTGPIAKASNLETGQTYIARVVNYEAVIRVMQLKRRLNQYRNFYLDSDGEELTSKILSPLTDIIKISDSHYLYFFPSEYENAHSYAFKMGHSITEYDALYIFKQILQILNMCHACGILLGEVVTNNFLLPNGDISKLRVGSVIESIVLENPDDDLISYKKVTHPEFLSPEVLIMNNHNQKVHGKAVEMWSVGVILFTLLYGKYPFYGETPAVLFTRITTQPLYTPTENLAKITVQILNGLLSKRPHKRPTARDLMLVDFSYARKYPCRRANIFRLQKFTLDCQTKQLEYEIKRREMLKGGCTCHDRLARLRDNIRYLQKRIAELRSTCQEEVKVHHDYMRARFLSYQLNGLERVVAEKRLRVINRGLAKLETPIELEMKDLSPELLLPPELYPHDPNYQISNNANHALAYEILKEKGMLQFTPILYEDRLHVFSKEVDYKL